MATAVDIAFLLMFVLGAFAYGSAFTLSLRQAAPVWAPNRTTELSRAARIELSSLVIFGWSAIWFVVLTLDQFNELVTGPSRRGWLDLVQLFLVFGFPPLIMQTMYQEAHVPEWTGPARRGAELALRAGYGMALGVLLFAVALIADLVALPNANAVIGGLIAGLFAIAGVYSAAVMNRNPRVPATRDGWRLRRVLNGLFLVLTLMNLLPVFVTDASLSFGTLGKLMSVTPLLFLSATTYYENRFEFYDLLVKRAAMLLATLAALVVFYVVALPFLDRLPAGPSRPWLFALAGVPLMMVAPRLSRALSQQLDRAWFGRHYTPVSAVTTVLASLQSATDEPSLIAAAEHSLTDVLGVTVRLTTDGAPPDGARTAFRVDGSIAEPSLWVVVPALPGERVLLSEDLTLLRSLGTVVTYLIENVRLQHKRQEQDLLAQELRVQSTQSELKALRAQINPHFLFNALNTVASLIHTDPARADRAVEQLSEVFRHTLRRSDSEWASLEQELAFAAAYLDVEEARFGARLQYRIDADSAARRALVPAMLVHTLIENAVKHGVAQQRGPGRLEIDAKSAGDRLSIEVRDNGPGPDASAEGQAFARRVGEQFGLRSIRDRLAGHFADAASFQLTRDAAHGTTIARIDMPLCTADDRAAVASEASA